MTDIYVIRCSRNACRTASGGMGRIVVIVLVRASLRSDLVTCMLTIKKEKM